MSYHAEVERLTAEVEGGKELYATVSQSPYVNDNQWFVSSMHSSNHPDAFADLINNPKMAREEWEACAGHVTFFALCADIRENIHHIKEEENATCEK